MIRARWRLPNRRARLPDDTQIVRDCLKGSEEAWAALVEKYKNLIYSIPIRYGFSSDDAADIAQAVYVDLLSDLPRLREPRALAAWLIQVTAHKCFHWKRQQQRHVSSKTETIEESAAPASAEMSADLLTQVEEDQALRAALAELPPRCRQLIEMLFFEEPAKPYHEVARSLGLATGSVGFTRGECLKQLRKRLQKKGIR